LNLHVFLACKLSVFSIGFCEKTIKSQTLSDEVAVATEESKDPYTWSSRSVLSNIGVLRLRRVATRPASAQNDTS